MLVPPLPAFGHGFHADGTRDKASPRRWRWATLTPRGVVMAVGSGQLSSRRWAWPRWWASEFVPQTDQSYTQLALRLPVGASLERTSAKVQQVEAIVLGMPEAADHLHLGGRCRPDATRPG